MGQEATFPSRCALSMEYSGNGMFILEHKSEISSSQFSGSEVAAPLIAKTNKFQVRYSRI